MTHAAWILASALSLVSASAIAAPGVPTSEFSIETEITVASDYRYRGVTLSDEQPALQLGSTLSHESGAYVSGWGSTIDEYGAGDDGRGATIEVDWGVGWAGVLRGVDVDASLQAYTYPGGENVNYIELPVTASGRLGDWRWTSGAAYAPAQRALGDQDNLYGWAGLAWAPEDSQINVGLQAGYEEGAFAPAGKWDWSLAVQRSFGRLDVGLAYVDSDAGGAGSVISLGARF